MQNLADGGIIDRHRQHVVASSRRLNFLACAQRMAYQANRLVNAVDKGDHVLKAAPIRVFFTALAEALATQAHAVAGEMPGEVGDHRCPDITVAQHTVDEDQGRSLAVDPS